MSGLAGKVALVTGAGSGIGEAVARRFAAQGAKVGITGRRAAPLKELASEIGALPLPGDVTDAATVDQAVARVVKEYVGLDIVVSNAGIAVVGNIEQLDDAAWSSVLETNLNGTRRVVRAALPHLRKRGGGAIVNISSIGALFAARNNAVYGTAKAALVALTMSLARDYGPEDIRVNALCPGWVDTPMLGPLLRFSPASAALRLMRRVHCPCNSIPATDASSFVTGATLLADGGQAIVDVGTVAFAPR